MLSLAHARMAVCTSSLIVRPRFQTTLIGENSTGVLGASSQCAWTRWPSIKHHEQILEDHPQSSKIHPLVSQDLSRGRPPAVPSPFECQLSDLPLLHGVFDFWCLYRCLNVVCAIEYWVLRRLLQSSAPTVSERQLQLLF